MDAAEKHELIDSFSDSNVLSPKEVSAERIQLQKTVTILGGVGLIVGSIIGSGIFLSPKGVLAYTGSIGLSLVVWVLCGIIALFGALCYAELGTAIPKSGANYAYLFEAFGPIPAFLFSWTGTLVIRPSAAAIISMIFAEYVARPFYNDDQGVPVMVIKLLAFFCIAIITIINCVSVRWAVIIQNLFTFAKLTCVIILVIIGFIELGKGHTANFKNSFNNTTSDIRHISFAFYYGLWAFGGWNSLNYVTEEMKNPGRDMPIAVIISMVIVIGCYVLCNIAYISVLGKAGILKSPAVALELGNIYLGAGKFIIPILVGLSCFGAVNGLAFSSGRLVYVAARDGHMPRVLSMVHVKRRTPLPSLLFLALVSTIMLIPDKAEFATLINFFSFANWVFYGACFVALIYLRFKRKDMERPYKVFLPIPFIMILFSIFLTVIPITDKPKGSAIALAMILAGLPAYLLFVHLDVLQYLPVPCKSCIESCLNSIQQSVGLAFPDNEHPVPC
ncbi:b(0,+)-type amino acid transporter 1-like isoform X2 [Hydractinia symbiolongicarpus]|uniref:b(0,+)-type amino acid transporter 1-like isoform X2 n=1 Tax=Hydractinia symbiolongicarpus TaxID=13093 RepID=UPI00255129A6|nr:b(0,+)-type amino acid transporter 1-like isoform X2 [Hydractinia symbiolongicarpus]